MIKKGHIPPYNCPFAIVGGNGIERRCRTERTAKKAFVDTANEYGGYLMICSWNGEDKYIHDDWCNHLESEAKSGGYNDYV